MHLSNDLIEYLVPPTYKRIVIKDSFGDPKFSEPEELSQCRFVYSDLKLGTDAVVYLLPSSGKEWIVYSSKNYSENNLYIDKQLVVDTNNPLLRLWRAHFKLGQNNLVKTLKSDAYLVLHMTYYGGDLCPNGHLYDSCTQIQLNNARISNSYVDLKDLQTIADCLYLDCITPIMRNLFETYSNKIFSLHEWFDKNPASHAVDIRPKTVLLDKFGLPVIYRVRRTDLEY